MVLENSVLFGSTESGIKRQNFGMRQFLFFQRFGGIPNFALAIEENQNIARRLAIQLFYRIKNTLQLVSVLVVLLISTPYQSTQAACDQRGGVGQCHPGIDPALPQMVGEGGHGRVHRRLVADDAVVEHIAARVQRHPARRAGRALGEVPAETGGLPREARQMGRLHRGVPQVLEAVAAPLVQGNEQDVSEHRIPFFGSAWWSAGRRRAQRCKPSAAQACNNCFV
jgi:hypothetical protein